MKNPMDSKSAKEREEEMGLSEGQKAALMASGLTKEEVNDIHKKRVAESIAKERELLAKMEKKVASSVGLADKLAKMLDSDSKEKVDSIEGEPIYTNAELERLILKECMKNPDYKKADEEYFNLAIDETAKDEDIVAAANRLADIIGPISEPLMQRRWEGYVEEYRKYVKDGEKGDAPDSFTEAYALPIFECFNRLQYAHIGDVGKKA